MAELPTIVSFWHGPLGYLERLCLASFVEKGHRVELYAYSEPEGVPAGITLLDAETVIPQKDIFFYKGNRTPAVFADLFRIRLLARGAGIWADCDVYCLRPFVGLPDYVFGYDSLPHWRNLWRPAINNAVLGAPAESALVAAMLSIFAPGAVPPGLPFWRRAEVAVRRALGEELPIHHMQFGATGPAPLGHFVDRLGLSGMVQPKDVFYALDYEDADRLLDAGSSLAGITTGRTLAVHIWNSALTDRHGHAPRRPEPGSFIATELARLGLEPGAA